MAYDQEYIHARVEVASSDCWEWSRSRNPDGYGRIRDDRAHRVAYRAFVGEIPEGMCVCHHCDNPSCCNPDHLFLGSHRENMADRDRKMRLPRGEGHHLAKLTEDQIRAIRKDPRSQVEIGNDYGVAQSVVWKIRNRVTWRHVL